MARLLPAVLALLSGCATYRAHKAACAVVQASRPWSYCVTRPGSTGDVVYHLHGHDGSETSWLDLDGYAGPVEAQWKASGYQPVVVGVSLGKTWLLDAASARELAEKVMPQIEERLGAQGRKRLLVGESMGGFNALQELLREPAAFAKVAALCPALMTIPPQPTGKETAAYIGRTSADPAFVERALRLTRAQFPGRRQWRKASPLLEAPALLKPDGPKLFLSCGKKDEYGFFEGAQKFSELAQDKGVSMVWAPVDGGHCAVPVAPLARFLSQ